MAASFPNGTLLAVSTAYGAAVAISGISNANPAVASASAPPADGTIGVLSSGWTDLTDRVFKSGGADTHSFQLLGANTTDVTRFPAGTGAGNFTPVETWVQLS